MKKIFRDPMSGLTHFVGFGLAIWALVMMLVRPYNTAISYTSLSIFGAGMILLYLFSTLYHWLPLREKGVRVFRKIDNDLRLHRCYLHADLSFDPQRRLGLEPIWCLLGFGGCGGFLETVLVIRSPMALHRHLLGDGLDRGGGNWTCAGEYAYRRSLFVGVGRTLFGSLYLCQQETIFAFLGFTRFGNLRDVGQFLSLLYDLLLRLLTKKIREKDEIQD